MTDLTKMISSHSSEWVEIEQLPQDSPEADQSSPVADQFLRYYQQFTSELPHSEALWRVPATCKSIRSSRFWDSLAQAIAKMIQ